MGNPFPRRHLALLGAALLAAAIPAAGLGLSTGGFPAVPGPAAPVSSASDRLASLVPAQPESSRGPEAADEVLPPTFDPSRRASIGPDGEPPAAPPPRSSARPVRLDETAGPDVPAPVALPARIELYPGTVSVMPGQALELHVSTPGSSYGYRVERLDATLPSGSRIVATAAGRRGRSYLSLVTFDSLTRTARANWPVTDRIDTSGWQPGVYVVTADDSAATQGRAIFVVRTPTLSPQAPAFVFPALTYQAYNLWGGANLYGYASPQASRVSFERPYDHGGGRGFWTRYDDRILGWLQRQHLPLQYTTDYDLASDPPEPAPRLLILPQHVEYVSRPLFEWVNRHVNRDGDMNVLGFGANGFYWQVRLATPRTPGAPSEIVCYKDPNADPAASVNPSLVTTRWRDEPVSQPEGSVLGAQYVGIVGDAYTRHDLKVTSAMPPELLAGTGWSAGTVIRGLLLGEGDAAYPGSGGLAVMEGQALDPSQRPITPTVTIRTSPALARLFMAGTFAWVDGLAPAKAITGVSAASFERFNRNVLAWLGFATAR